MTNYNLILSKIKNFSNESDKILYFGILNWLVKKLYENDLIENSEVYDDLSMGVLAIRIFVNEDPIAELTILPGLYISIGAIEEIEFVEDHLGSINILDWDENDAIVKFFDKIKKLTIV